MSTQSPPVRRAMGVLVEAHLTAFGKTYAKARGRDVPPRRAYVLASLVALGLAPATACEEELMVRRARSMLA